MSYKFAGTAGSHALRSAVSAAPFPGAWPLSFAGWAQFNDLSLTSADSQPFSLEIDGNANQNRIQLSSDVSDVDFDFVLKVGASTFTISIDYGIMNILRDDWVFLAFVIRADADRQGYCVHRGTLYSSVVDTNSLTYPAFDRVTFGYLPFFGGVIDHQGRIGASGLWSRKLTEPEILRMGRGEPLENFRNGMVDMWRLDGRVVSTTIKSMYHKLPLTVTGPPAWSIQQEPRITKRFVFKPVAASGDTSGIVPNEVIFAFSG